MRCPYGQSTATTERPDRTELGYRRFAVASVGAGLTSGRERVLSQSFVCGRFGASDLYP